MSPNGRSVSQLSPLQLANARAIIQVGQSLNLPEKAWIIALCVALQESDLGAHPATSRPNSDGDAGVFQQRSLPGWYGSVDQVNNIQYAATVFYMGKKLTHTDVRGVARPAGPAGYTIPGLAQIVGWQAMPVTVAAQAVQRSAYPAAYAKHEPLAREIVAEVTGNPTAPDSPRPSASAAIASITGKQWLFIAIGSIVLLIAVIRLTGVDRQAGKLAKTAVSAYSRGLVNVK